MNWLTLVLVAIIALLTWRAYRNGFVIELVGLCSLILAVPIAGIFYDDMYPKVQPIVDNEDLASLLSFLFILFGVVIAGQVAAHLLRGFVSMLNLGSADHVAGGVFGFLKAVIVCQVILLALVVFPDPDLRDAIDDSAVANRLLDTTDVVLFVLPSRFDDGLALFGKAIDGIAGEPNGPTSANARELPRATTN